MNSRPTNANEVPLHHLAEQEILNAGNTYLEITVLQAKILAYKKGDDMVLTSHVREALDIVDSEKKRTWGREIAIVIGGASLGAFAQGFVTELTLDQLRAIPIAIYVVMGFLGLLLVAIALRR